MCRCAIRSDALRWLISCLSRRRTCCSRENCVERRQERFNIFVLISWHGRIWCARTTNLLQRFAINTTTSTLIGGGNHKATLCYSCWKRPMLQIHLSNSHSLNYQTISCYGINDLHVSSSWNVFSNAKRMTYTHVVN